MSDDFDRLSDAEVVSVLRYLADFMSDPDAKEPFKGMAINRIKDKLLGDRTKQNRLLLLIRKLSRAEQSNLRPLNDAIKKDLAPLPGRGGSRP